MQVVGGSTTHNGEHDEHGDAGIEVRRWHSTAKVWVSLPLLDGRRRLLSAFQGEEGIDGLHIIGEDLIEEVKVFGVESDAVLSDRVSDSPVVQRID